MGVCSSCKADEITSTFTVAVTTGETQLTRATGETTQNFQNMSDHKSRNARAVHAIFCLLYPQQNHSVTLLCTPY